MEKKSLLVIPHFPLVPNLLTRGEALAQGLAADFDVHLLSWHYGSSERSPRISRAAARLAGLARPIRLSARGRLTVIHSPLLYVRHPRLRFVAKVNTAIVNRIVRTYRIDLVLNQLAVVNSRDLARPHFIDIVDLPGPGEIARWQRQAARARGITTITEGLGEVLARHGLAAEIIGNGADVERFRSAAGDEVRRAHGLVGKLVIGYIGNHAEWSGLPFLLDVFKGVKREIPEAVLLVVGPGTEVPAAKAKCDRERIGDAIFTGPVDLAKVPQYFQAIDVAVLPFELDPHAALSFPIKLIEYSAARKIVVASPLAVLKTLGLPNVRAVEREVAPWVTAIAEARVPCWRPEWDSAVDTYDWQNLARKLARYIRTRL